MVKKYLISEALNVRGFWGPLQNRGDKKNKKNCSVNIHEILKKKQAGLAGSVDQKGRLVHKV